MGGKKKPSPEKDETFKPSKQTKQPSQKKEAATAKTAPARLPDNFDAKPESSVTDASDASPRR